MNEILKTTSEITLLCFPENMTIHELFEVQVNKTPDKIALIFGNSKTSFWQLNEQVNQLAHYLRKNYLIKPDEPIGIITERSDRMIVGLLAILKAGGAYLPIDPTNPVDRIKYMVDDSKMKVLLTEDPMFSQFKNDFPDKAIVDIWDKKYYSENKENPVNINHPSDLVYIIYTSGSTGTPKGVMIEHRNLVTYVNAFRDEFKIDQNDTYLQVASVSFDAFAEELFVTILSGAQVVVTTKREVWDVELLAKKINENQASYISSTPALLGALNDVLVPKNKLTIVVGGDVLRMEHIDKLIRKCSICNAYGPTEATICATYYQIIEPFVNPIPIGKAILNYRVYILDNKNNKVADGAPGELCIGGPGLARGYLGNEELSKTKFTDNPVNPGERIYRTGDLCRFMPDGNIEFIGRIDDQVKIRGFRIELGEIEKTIVQFPEIKESAVTLIDSEGNKELVAYVISGNRATHPSIEYSFDIEGLIDFLKKTLPNYMIPTYYVEMDQFPKTTTDKIDRKNLPLPGKKNLKASKEFIPPTSTIELEIAQIWKLVLNHQQISIIDNFFDVGGHSLMAFKIVGKVNELFAIHFPLKEFFDKPTIADMSKMVEKIIKSGELNTLYQPLTKIPRSQPLPLSPGQLSLWFIDQFTGESPLYNIPMTIRMSGKLNVNNLTGALNEIVKRHEALRTTFHSSGGDPVQVINEFVHQPLITKDVSAFDKIFLQSELTNQAIKTFDLSKPFLFRWKLFKQSETEHILFLNIHHLVTDGWSVNIFFKELEYFYNTSGVKISISESPAQYPDYANWMQHKNNSDFFSEQLNYWENKLGKNPESTEFPTDLPRPALQSFNGNVVDINLSYDLTRALKRFSHQNGKTLFMTLLGAYKVLLNRLTGRSDITIGSPSANRTLAETEDMMGYFINSLVMKTDLSGDPTFREVLDRIQQTTLEAYENQEVPFEKVVSRLVTKRNAQRSVLFQILFVLENAAEGFPRLDNLIIETREIPTGTAKVDLSFIIEEMNNETNVKVEYNTDLYYKKTIVRLLELYKNILNEVLVHADLPISKLALEGMSHKIGKKESYFDSQIALKSVVKFFEEQVDKTPENIAIIFNDQQLTYRELNQKANQLARFIEKNETDNSPLVGILMERSIDLPITILGILKTGKAYLPLNPQYPEERINYMMQDTGTKLVLVSPDYKDFFDKKTIKIIDLVAVQEQLTKEPASNLNKTISPEDLAYIMYTSGTTGKPNGVEIAHRGITRLVIGNDYFSFGPSQTFLQLAPVSFDASTFEIWGALLHGSKLVIYPERVPTFTFLKKLIHFNKISCLWLTASLFNMIIEEDPETISGVSFVLTGGEALSVKYISLAQKYLPNTQFINGYGPTESTTFTCCYAIPPTGEKQLQSIPIGTPIANTEVIILDENMNLVPDGVQGELFIGGKGLALGYHKKPELNAQKFIKNPFDENGDTKLYRSGDLCRVNEEGNIEFIGRIDNQVKIRGYRIELGEIENRLLQHEQIKECVVVANKSTENTVLVAYLVADKQVKSPEVVENASSISKAELQEFLSTDLPEYMIPEYFIFLNKFSLNANGKIDRSKFPDPFIIEESEILLEKEELNETETKIKYIWEEVLNRKHIKAGDNFFEIGGHSLLAAKIIFKVNNIFGGNLLVSAIFQSPSLREFAKHVEKTETHEPMGDIIQIRPGLGKPIFLFSGIDGNPFSFTKLANHYRPGQPLYFIQYPAGGNNEIQYKSLEEYVQALIGKIKIIQNTGPYAIVGYSLGGRIAFETALQLQSSSEKISFLAILSALPPLFTKTTNPFVNFILVESDVFFKINFKLKLKYLRHRTTHLFERFYRKISKTSDQGKFESVHLFVDVDEEVEKYLGMYNIWRKYAIKSRFNGDMLLIRESGLDEDWKYTAFYFDQIYPDYRWSKFVNGNIAIEAVPIAHNSLLEEPYVQEIAKLLNHYISKTEDK